MWLKSLTLNNYRNFERLSVEFGPTVNIFYGLNGSGKTNLLEGIFNLCLGRSQRGASDIIMLRENKEVYRIEGEVLIGQEAHSLTVAYQRKNRKKVTLDQEVIRLTGLYDYFCVVSAGPEDSEILSGAPSVRRSFMDIYLSQLSRSYLTDLGDYQKVLLQKNAALKRNMDPSPFEPQQVQLGAKIMNRRFEFCRELRARLSEYYSQISGGEQINCEYQPSVKLDADHLEIEEIETAFTVKLENYAERERIMQTAMVGPHRDDIYFEINGFPARTHGSQGQWRTAAIGCKLAIYDLLRQTKEETPILLLDEIFAELDSKRCDQLIEAFGNFSQLFLTTATEPPEHLKNGSVSFMISGGTIAGRD